MSITLDELFLLVGRLDDAPGFDTPRERFRRFLLERVTDVPTARALIDDCQRSVGEQRHRALQDLVVTVGGLLGFEITFGSYEPADGVKMSGLWRSPGLLDVVLEIRTEQTMSPTLDGLAAAMAATAAAGRAEPRIGLCVVARQYAARDKLRRALAADTRLSDIRVVSVRSLLALAAQAAAERLAHAEVVTLLRSSVALDFVIELLDRRVSDGRPSEPTAERGGSAGAADHHEPAFWAATITGNEMAAPEQWLVSVIAERRVLAICHAGHLRSHGSPGDWVCFFVPGRGIVGHAQLASIIEDSGKVVRHFRRFSCVYRLAHVVLYERPIVQALRADRPFATPPADFPLAGPCLAPMTRQDFLALTTFKDGAATLEGARSATAQDVAAS
jgi:hypothetical protein